MLYSASAGYTALRFTGGYSNLPPLGALLFTPISHILPPHIEREDYLYQSVKKKETVT
jgi:hypothetical protein